jgi:hypothetical protein
VLLQKMLLQKTLLQKLLQPLNSPLRSRRLVTGKQVEACPLMFKIVGLNACQLII